MCGINGIIKYTNFNDENLSETIAKMNDLIIHRGPDDDGDFVKLDNDFGIAMGMRRLSIIDLKSGHQPIFSKDKQIIIVFNGEIYNYLELKKDLQQKGVLFETNSDTEVILKLYEEEGPKSFKKLDGMFAFGIYDKKKKKVFIARDFFGEKPLYYTQTKNEFIWCSELKSLIAILPGKPTLSNLGINLFFRLTYIPAPYTIYDNIHKLEPNHYLTFDLNSSDLTILPIEEESFNPSDKKEQISLGSAKNIVKDMVYESVQSRSISDVPLGTFLSGGVDSSIISLCLSEIKSSPIDTFSIGFEKKRYDETDKSQAVAKMIGSKHHEFIIGEKDLENNIHDILVNFDEPFADSSALPTFLVSNKTKQHVKVALTGDGGDEVFGGYNKYYMGKMNSQYLNIVPQKLHSYVTNMATPLLRNPNDKRGYLFKIKRLLDSVNYDEQYYWDIISLGYTSNTIENYLLPSYVDNDIFAWYKQKSGIDNPNTLTKFRNIDRNISLEGDMLVKVDRTSMLNSLECRAPFLNKKIWNYTNSLPESYLMKGWNKKFILKEAFKDQFPKDFLDKRKSGFGVPVGDWLKSSIKKELESYIDEKKLVNQEIFQVNNIQQLVINHLSGKEENTFKVWTFYCFQKWYYNTYQSLL